MQLPELEGSKKQVDWAISIREKLINAINAKILENRLIDFVNRADEINQNISEAMQRRRSAKWWIENRDITADCLIAIALLQLKLIKPGEPFRVKDTYQEKTEQSGEWIVTREAENINLVIPVYFKSSLTLETAKKVYIVEQWNSNLQSASVTTTRPADSDNIKISTLVEAFDRSRSSMSGWASRDLALVVLKYSFSYPREAAPYLSCYGLTRSS